MLDLGVILLTAALVAITSWYAWLTKRIAEASETSSRVSAEASQAAARSAHAAEAALLADTMPFVRPEFGAGGSGTGGAHATMTVTNSGVHAALNVELLIGDDLLHSFPIVEPGKVESKDWRGDAVAKRLWDARGSGWVLSTRYSDPYGNRYQVVVENFIAGGFIPPTRVKTYRIREDGTRIPLVGESSPPLEP